MAEHYTARVVAIYMSPIEDKEIKVAYIIS